MNFSKAWHAIGHETQLAAQQIATGITALGHASHAHKGQYFLAFFGLSIGLERMGKIIFVADYAINNNGRFPVNGELRQFNHNLNLLLTRCELIGNQFVPKNKLASKPTDVIHLKIIELLSEFAESTRYYNLDYLSGKSGEKVDPVSRWWTEVCLPIHTRHYTEKRRLKDVSNAELIDQFLGRITSVIHHGEDGSEIRDLRSLASRAGLTAISQRYGRFYTLQIVRWLASIIDEIEHLGSYKKGIEPLMGLGEPFALFRLDDSFFKNRKVWNIE